MRYIKHKFKYIFIAGLEHSGTTLLSQILASEDGVLALGEVAPFFSTPHMRDYLAKWEHFDDVRSCSCGKNWSECSFWSGMMAFNGQFLPQDIDKAYAKLFHYIADRTECSVIVDSSKSNQYLSAFLNALENGSADRQDVLILVIAKDPRGFAFSIGRKQSKTSSVLAYLRAMSWWCSFYEVQLETFRKRSATTMFLTYEQLCKHPEQLLRVIGQQLGLIFKGQASVSHHNSHIALGNKDFIERNSDSILYDAAWMNNSQAHIAYKLNRRARRTHRLIMDLAHAHFHAP